MDNYEKMLAAAQKRCAGYDMVTLAKKPGVCEAEMCLHTLFLGMAVTISKENAAVTVNGKEADFGQALSVYDWLCDRKETAVASNEFCPVGSLPGVFVGGKGLGMQLPKLAKRIHEKSESFRKVMEELGAEELPLGDMGWRLRIFPDLPMCIKFYFGDEEFAPQLTLLWDKNSMQFVRYETLYYIAGCLYDRLLQLL